MTTSQTVRDSWAPRLRTLGALGTSKVLALCVSVVAVRLLPEQELTVYFLFIGIGGFGGTVVALGVDQYAYRVLPPRSGRHLTLEDHVISPQFYVALNFWLILLFAPPAALYGLTVIEEGASSPLAVFSSGTIVIGAGALRRLGRTSALAVGKPAQASLLEGSVFYGTLLACFGVAHALNRSLGGLTVVSIASAASLLAGGSYLLWRFPGTSAAFSKVPADLAAARVLIRWARPNFVSQLAAALLNRGDVLVLAIVGSPTDIVTYGIAVRLTYFVSLASELTTLMVGSRLAVVGVNSEGRTLRSREVRQALLVSGGLVALLATPMLLFPLSVARLVFGDTYSGPPSVIVLLLLGKALTATTNPLNVLLTAAGRNRESARGYASAAVAFLLVSIVPVGVSSVRVAMGAFLALLIIAANNLAITFGRPSAEFRSTDE